MYIPILPLLKLDFASWTGRMQKFFQHLMGVGLSMYLGVIFDIEAIYFDLTHVACRTKMDERNKSIWQVEQDGCKKRLELYKIYTW